jgi:mRNA interferase RelE/StbE
LNTTHGLKKDMKAIDRAMQREILNYMDARIATDDDPRRFGKPLGHELHGLWRIGFGSTGLFAIFGNRPKRSLF